jgi:hypothetical protein
LHSFFLWDKPTVQIDESVNILSRRLERHGILMGAAKVAPPGLPNRDGDIMVGFHIPPDQRLSKQKKAETLLKSS